MALFNRRKQDTVVLPEEVREYYQAERRERTGRAWLLALATLLVTFLIAAALFFGGRWLYRAVFENDDASKTTTSQTEEAGENTSSTATEEADTEEDGEAEQGTEAADQSVAAPTTPQTAPTSSPTQLINTGPGDEL